MALYFKTSDPKRLLFEIDKAIKDGRIVTWSQDADGDFTHIPEQWRNKAWLRPIVVPGMLKLVIIRPSNVAISSEVYAVFHGRFIESMLFHCDKFFETGEATALATNEDRVI